ncbi:MAG: cytochrome P450 [Gammaproteobacteria bacterium]|nr:MAG: cytochrome P450 [Gammaproteobacteria bacterium]
MLAPEPIMRLENIDLCNLDNFETGCPLETFRFLRQEAPVWFHPPGPHNDEGFWVISRQAEAREILKNHQVFSSETGYGAREGGGTTLEDMSTEMGPGVVLSMMDPPKHDAIRGIVSQGFFPKNLALLEPKIRDSVQRLLAPMQTAQGEFDFLNDVAAQLPLEVICTIGGVPREDWPKMKVWADAAIGYATALHDPTVDVKPLVDKLTEMGMYAWQLIQQLRETPTDSIMSAIVHAEIPGEDGQPRRLDDIEAIRFFNLLITGGAETTRNAIAYGYYALLQHPEQYRVLEAEPEKYLDGAIEEMLRWSSAVHFNRRTAAADYDIAGQTIHRGDKVTIWYPSANRDEAVFERPDSFDIFRKRNPHLAFGHGIHHCLGAALARLEFRILMEELLVTMKGKSVAPAAPIRFIRSNRHQGVAYMSVNIG